ncbi:hypothetical protein [Acinetobacter sp. CFCC 10889]|uniref:hypothetical protein n=1 Tax=Acinetobacter sp. CFCC 10889 TaxID=1775557 RepID=UPI000DCFFBDA|nr:hypothetical protein [Acinetobacter sp. CFCC 10889]
MKLLLTACLSLFLVSCSKPVQTDETTIPTQDDITTPKEQSLKSERISSLTTSSANSPSAFYNEMVNGRVQFNNQLDEIDSNTVRQTIRNDSNTITAILDWKKLSPNEWESTKLDFIFSNQVDRDSFQTILRLPYRLKDHDTISNAMKQSIDEQRTVHVRLINGAVFTVIREPSGTHLIIE